MKTFFSLLFFIPSLSFGACMDFYKKDLVTLQGEKFDLCEHQDKPIIFVNTASKCGFTSQFEALESLYKAHKKDITVVGFPSNDFNQELSTDKEIQEFCKLTYAVEFPMMSKSSVIGKNANPIYQYLYDKTGKAPMWNFYKFVVMPGADDIHVFSSIVQPDSEKMLGLLKPYFKD
ncbi:glutathione peroxidase [Methylophilaceae bacterium]|nr:glutathione peroxidase [Methylophilaceae bacterium]